MKAIIEAGTATVVGVEIIGDTNGTKVGEETAVDFVDGMERSTAKSSFSMMAVISGTACSGS